MALALDATASYDSGSSSVSTSGSINITIAANCVMFIGVNYDTSRSVNNIVSGADSASLVTGSRAQDILANNRYVAWYYMYPSSSGSYNVSVNMSGTTRLRVAVITFTGADTTTPYGAVATTSDTSGTSVTTNITTTRANGFLIDYLTEDGTSSTAGASQTSWQSTGTSPKAFASRKSFVAVGSDSMSWSWTGSNYYAHSVVEVVPPPAASSTRSPSGGAAYGSPMMY